MSDTRQNYRKAEDNTMKTENIDEHADVGMGGTTGGGMLGGGTPNDIAEGRSAFHVEETPDRLGDGTPEGEAERGRLNEPAGSASPDIDGPVLIGHDPAGSEGTTDAGLSDGGGTRSGTGGLISGGLPEELPDNG
jgi:hypothetical protein